MAAILNSKSDPVTSYYPRELKNLVSASQSNVDMTNRRSEETLPPANQITQLNYERDFINSYTTGLIRHLSNASEAARRGLCPGGKGNRARAARREHGRQ